MSSGWLYDDCTPLDRSVSEHSPFGIPLLYSAVCLCACLCPVTLRAHLPVIVYALLVVVLSCKRKLAGLCIIAEVLRSVTRRMTRRRLAGGLQGSGVFGMTPRHNGHCRNVAATLQLRLRCYSIATIPRCRNIAAMGPLLQYAVRIAAIRNASTHCRNIAAMTCCRNIAAMPWGIADYLKSAT